MGEEYNEKVFSVHPHHPSCMVHLLDAGCTLALNQMCNQMNFVSFHVSEPPLREVEPIEKKGHSSGCFQHITSFLEKNLRKIWNFLVVFSCKND
jgi:hypothetical protein